MSLIKEIVRDAGLSKPKLHTRIIALIVGILFGAAGIFVFVSEFLKPLSESQKAKDWVKIEALVLKSELVSDGDSKNIELLYQYSFKGQQYQNNRFELSNAGRNFNTQAFKDTVGNYPKESLITVWVDPQNPSNSVYNRDMLITHWIVLPFSIPFITVGLCGVLFFCFDSIVFRIQLNAWKEAAHIANRHGAFQISKDLLDEQFSELERAKINFLKREKLLKGIGYFLMFLFVGCIVSVFLIFIINFLYSLSKTLGTLASFAALITFMSLTGKWLKLIFASKGDDFLIISKWNYEFTEVTHRWLYLGDPKDAQEIGLFSCATETNRELKKLLKTNPSTDIFTAPDKNVISGSISHTIQGSPQKNLDLLIHTKNLTSQKCDEHKLRIFTPEND